MNTRHEHQHAHVCACHSEEKKAAGECCQDRAVAIRQVLAMAAAAQQKQGQPVPNGHVRAGCACGGNCRNGRKQESAQSVPDEHARVGCACGAKHHA